MQFIMLSKRSLLWASLLAIAFSQFIAACGGSSSSSNGPVDLTVWTTQAVSEVGNPDSSWSVYKIVRQKLNINLHVQFIPQGDAGDIKVSAAAAANNLPDLFQITNLNLFRTWVQLGLVAPVDSLLPKMPQRTRDRYSNATLNRLVTTNGKLYALQEANLLARPIGLFIRKDWLAKLGLQAPQTLDDFLNVAKAFTTRDPDGDGKNDTYGFGGFTTNSVTGLGNSFTAFLGAFGLPGAWNFNSSGKVSLSVRDPNYLKAIQFIKQLSDSKVIDPEWTTLNNSDFRAKWKQGKYGMMLENFCAAECKGNYQTFDTNYPNGVWEQFGPLQGPAGTTSYLGSYSNAGLRMAVSQKGMNAGKADAIARFLEWANSGEGYYLLGYGTKGVNYTLDAQGNVTTAGVPTPFTDHAGAPVTQMRNIVYRSDPAELKVRYPSFTAKNGRKIDPIQIYNTIASMPWQDQTSADAIPPASNQSDLNRYIDEGLVQFVTGQKALTATNWSAFLQGLNSLNAADWEAKANQTLKDKGLL